ncbi:MAG: long-chain-fatty-acid--AMP ligase FadD32 [Gordonia sp. (in: high G+C Gram-positive bacteria)]|uniref:long-chain-fatty-acid--AMP ligase FadD32 n=1 Tax=Gordonia sp. (in: high G+C Gram-positive bacteria) TaxID=84139 RepID=UPI0039E25CBD
MLKTEFDQFLDENGQLHFTEDATLVDYVEHNVREKADTLAYRFKDYSRERDGENIDLTWAQFGKRLRAVAARLQQVTKPGDRVAILAPQSLEYVIGFFASMYASNIAVPLFSPDEPGHTDRLVAVLADCEPTAILTSTKSAEAVRDFFKDRPAKDRPRVIAVDAVPDSVGDTWVAPVAGKDHNRDTVAYLQYTSGSTRVPAGVEITYEAVAANVLQIYDCIEIDRNARGVTWLPMFHDMGLLTVILPALGGSYITIMSPAAFVRRPGRWIKELAAEDDPAPTFAAAPNFAYEHAAARGLPAAGESLDLSNVIGLINGSEPVTVSSMRKFNEAFEPYGLSPKAIKPCYGMAEATLFVSATQRDNAAKITYVDREKLNAGEFVEVAEDAENAVTQVSCGQVALSEWAVIVDADAGTEQPDGRVGEIWLHGLNIGKGYWNKDDETEATFHNKLKSRQPDSHAEGAPEDGDWMATGDYGVFHDGELYITGRVKDLVIVDGRNHYPQDLEASAQESSTALRPGYVAAFAVPANQLPAEVFENGTSGLKPDPQDASEQLVIVAERGPGRKVDPSEIADTVRAAVAGRHGVMVRDLLLVPAGSIPRTSSGKIARRATKAAYIDGTLRGGYQQTAFPDAKD